MCISVNQIPKIEFPSRQIWYRIQRIHPRKESVRLNKLILPPGGSKAGRFCLATGVTAYLADSPETAFYEAIFRRDLKSFVALADLRLKALCTFFSKEPLKVLDLRGLEEQYPFLLSQRYELTQAIAEECFGKAYDGILYSSAQHAHHVCTCLFEQGIKKLEMVQALPLVKPGTDILLETVIFAARRSGVEIT